MLSNVNKVLAIFCVFSLFFSFGLHAVQVEHMHYGVKSAEVMHTHTHTSVSAHDTHDDAKAVPNFGLINDQAHAAEKKMVLFFVATSLLFFAFASRRWEGYQLLTFFILTRMRALQAQRNHILYAYIRKLYALGVLNPKLY